MQCTFDDARRNQLLDGIRMSTERKLEFFEEMVDFIAEFGAFDRLAKATDSPEGTLRGRIPPRGD